MKKIIGISGLAGSGKSTVSDFLCRDFGFVPVALADPMKRFCKDVFGFSDAQLWGPSSMRNTGDPRYVRMQAGSLGTTTVGFGNEGMPILDPNPKEDILLSPRYALQQLGTEWGRQCYANLWIDYGIRVADTLLAGGVRYTPETGLISRNASNCPPSGVVFSDIRFENEVMAIRNAGGAIARLKRGTGLKGSDAQHLSETEQSGMPDDLFDYVIDNRDGVTDSGEPVVFSLSDLRRAVAEMVRHLW